MTTGFFASFVAIVCMYNFVRVSTRFALYAVEGTCETREPRHECTRLRPDHVVLVDVPDWAPGLNKEGPVQHQVVLRSPCPRLPHTLGRIVPLGHLTKAHIWFVIQITEMRLSFGDTDSEYYSNVHAPVP